MATNFEKEVARIWDTVMPTERWFKWNEEDEDSNQEIMMFAAHIARRAFEAGVKWGNASDCIAANMIVHELNIRYPLPKATKWRTVRDVDGSCEWQVRDGITWYRSITGDGKLRQHLPVANVITARVDLGDFAGAALLADLAANPTEE